MKSRLLYAFARMVMGWVLHGLYRIKVEGAAHIPAEGPFILTANHIHSLDPAVLAVVMKRGLCFMAKKELFTFRLKTIILYKLGAFPVDRAAADMQSYRTALGLLAAGEGLLIFSQGSRMKEFDNVKNGVAMFALKSGAPVVPAGISGRYGLFSVLRVRFGPPIDMRGYEGRKIKTELVNEVMTAVKTAVKELTV